MQNMTKQYGSSQTACKYMRKEVHFDEEHYRCPLCGIALKENGVCPKCGYTK